MPVFDPSSLSRRTLLQRGAALAALLAVPGSAVAQEATPDTGTVADLVAGNTAFAFDLYAQLRQVASGNLLLSPYSVSVALAMTWGGAAGETAAQMADVLGFDLPASAVNDAFAALNADLVARGAGDEAGGALHLANALWGAESYPFSEAYTAELVRAYGAGLRTADFATAPEAARAEINDWVAAQTEDRIQDIVPAGTITPATRLVLANAISFVGHWRQPFEKASTASGTFHRRDGDEVTVPFMVQQASLPYAAGDGYQVIELPYAQEGFAMTILMPDAGTFDTFETESAVAALDGGLEALDWTEMLLHLPRFRFDSSESFAAPLKALGMTYAFDMAVADFSGMVAGTPPEPLAISDVLHKAFISVDEDGTEASAATVVIGVGSAATPSEPLEVRVDRPFLFAIRDTVSGTILFLGRLLDP